MMIGARRPRPFCKIKRAGFPCPCIFKMLEFNLTKQTILQYDTPGPRYTSYPTAPEWSTDVNATTYQEKLAAFGQGNKTLSLYIHIPFCQSMCYYCACNVVIRKNDAKYGDEYLEYLFKEIDLVHRYIVQRPKVKQFHWGGGTPTFLNENQIQRLFTKVTQNFDLDFNGEIAIEIDPRTIDKEKVKSLRQLGFNRVSMGIQDFDPTVQSRVNRLQPFEMVKEFYDWCRELRFLSINFDLIYGLPQQQVGNFSETLEKVVGLRPDRIALYSFAYVPWLKRHQRKIDIEELPSNNDKLDIFLKSREQLLSSGYQAIAMDHFALKTDEMARAFNEGTLYRNFMGYTLKPADEYLGLGLTAIGFLENTYVQNYKTINDYYRLLKEDTLPVERGKVLSHDDQIRQWVINSLMCRFKVDKSEFKKKFSIEFDGYFDLEQAHITKCLEDGLLSLKGNTLLATDMGRIFIRNVCMGFDGYLRQPKAHKEFSRTV